MNPGPPRSARFGDLGTRVASGLVLAAVAFVAVWLGGVVAAALVALALCLMLWELGRMVTGSGDPAAPVMLVLVLSALAAVAVTAAAGPAWGIACLVPGALLARFLAPRGGDLLAAGALYMGVPLCALLAIRLAGPEGAFVILWLVLVVAAADVGAYFAGRTIGGPKLAPRISPGKTRSGAAGGLVAAGAASLAFALGMGWSPGWALLIGVGVAVASQGGDLLESAVKRHFGVKDASQLIPGHGGVMDRLDALLGGAWFYALWSLAFPGVSGA